MGIFLEGEDSHGDHGLGKLVEFRFKAPPGTTSPSITTHTPSGQRNCASWASQVGYTPAMPRREDHEVHKGHVVALEKKSKSIQTSNFMKIRPAGAELFLADGQTDRQTHKHKDRQTDRHTSIRTDRHAEDKNRFSQFCEVKFHENPSGGSRVVPCGRRDRQTDRHTHRHKDRQT